MKNLTNTIITEIREGRISTAEELCEEMYQADDMCDWSADVVLGEYVEAKLGEDVWEESLQALDSLCEQISLVVEAHVSMPMWIDKDSVPDDVEEFVAWCRDVTYSGCASGVYMPAVTYFVAVRTMEQHADDLLDYIDQQTGDVAYYFSTYLGTNTPSWSGLASHLLSCGVEIWAASWESRFEEFNK